MSWSVCVCVWVWKPCWDWDTFPLLSRLVYVRACVFACVCVCAFCGTWWEQEFGRSIAQIDLEQMTRNAQLYNGFYASKMSQAQLLQQFNVRAVDAADFGCGGGGGAVWWWRRRGGGGDA